MSNIVTHNTNLPGGSVQSYATDEKTVVLDLNRQFVARFDHMDDGPQKALYELSLIQALALARILEAAIRDAQSGTYVG
jgi:hypothetical protein